MLGCGLLILFLVGITFVWMGGSQLGVPMIVVAALGTIWLWFNSSR